MSWLEATSHYQANYVRLLYRYKVLNEGDFTLSDQVNVIDLKFIHINLYLIYVIDFNLVLNNQMGAAQSTSSSPLNLEPWYPGIKQQPVEPTCGQGDESGDVFTHLYVCRLFWAIYPTLASSLCI